MKELMSRVCCWLRAPFQQIACVTSNWSYGNHTLQLLYIIDEQQMSHSIRWGSRHILFYRNHIPWTAYWLYYCSQVKSTHFPIYNYPLKVPRSGGSSLKVMVFLNLKNAPLNLAPWTSILTQCHILLVNIPVKCLSTSCSVEIVVTVKQSKMVLF